VPTIWFTQAVSEGHGREHVRADDDPARAARAYAVFLGASPRRASPASGSTGAGPVGWERALAVKLLAESQPSDAETATTTTTPVITNST